MNPYLNPYYNPYQYGNPQANLLPQQQIITAKGKASIDSIRLAPNSSVLIADETAPIIWKCTSDGLGKVTAEAWDIQPHKEPPSEEEKKLEQTLNNIECRLSRLEKGAHNESVTEGNYAELKSSKGNTEKPKSFRQSASNVD